MKFLTSPAATVLRVNWRSQENLLRLAVFLTIIGIAVATLLLRDQLTFTHLGPGKVRTRHIFYQEPPFIDEVLPEMCRVRTLPGSRWATIQSLRSSVNLFGQRKHRNILHQLKELPNPLMTVWGQEDSIIPVSQAVKVQQELPNCLVHVIAECGHWPHMEKASAFNSLILDFLST